MKADAIEAIVDGVAGDGDGGGEDVWRQSVSQRMH